MRLRANHAIETLERLKEEAGEEGVLRGGEEFVAWKGKVRGVIAAALGGDEHLLDRFDEIRYALSLWTDGTPESAWDRARARGIQEACGVVSAAIFQLRLYADKDEPVDLSSFDPDLWEEVKHLVEGEQWGQVASQTAIFVEHRIRQWADDPQNTKGDSLIGKELMGRVFANESEWRLGARVGESEGWRFLAMGFTQALSNVDRHRIQKRDDSQRYAIGVLGLGSLLLTQLRYEHEVLIAMHHPPETVHVSD